jgi:hypothetical protein
MQERGPLPDSPQPRRRALAELEVQLADAEEVRARYAGHLDAQRRARQDARRAAILLRMVEERLAQLHRSQRVLLDGEDR